ncbi:MAG TPA: glycosyltransferase, partial [Pirellulales bacterium]
MLMSQRNLSADNFGRNKPIRILHFLGLLGHGGIEVWLMNVMRALDHTNYQFDFVVHSREPGPFDAEVHELGGRVLSLDPPQRKPWSYKRQLSRLLKEHGPYDVVHSHVHFVSGCILPIAASCGVPLLIAHSHDDKRAVEKNETLARKAIINILKRRTKKYANVGLACSSLAAASLFGEQWATDPRWQVLNYGFDFSSFSHLPEQQTLRKTLGLPLHGKIVGNVGRFVYQKNHDFAVRVLKELVGRGEDVHLLCVGSGKLENEVREQLRQAGLTARATL